MRSITRRKYNRFGESTSLWNLPDSLSTREAYTITRPGETRLEDIKNDINRTATGMLRAGCKKSTVAVVVGIKARLRGPIGSGPYACSCDNFSPRWTRDNQCCPGCFALAIKLHQDMSVNGVVPPTIKMVEDGQSHGININRLKEILAGG